jgi:hypothetical protein
MSEAKIRLQGKAGPLGKKLYGWFCKAPSAAALLDGAEISLDEKTGDVFLVDPDTEVSVKLADKADMWNQGGPRFDMFYAMARLDVLKREAKLSPDSKTLEASWSQDQADEIQMRRQQRVTPQLRSMLRAKKASRDLSASQVASATTTGILRGARALERYTRADKPSAIAGQVRDAMVKAADDMDKEEAALAAALPAKPDKRHVEIADAPYPAEGASSVVAYDPRHRGSQKIGEPRMDRWFIKMFDDSMRRILVDNLGPAPAYDYERDYQALMAAPPEEIPEVPRGPLPDTMYERWQAAMRKGPRPADDPLAPQSFRGPSPAASAASSVQSGTVEADSDEYSLDESGQPEASQYGASDAGGNEPVRAEAAIESFAPLTFGLTMLNAAGLPVGDRMRIIEEVRKGVPSVRTKAEAQKYIERMTDQILETYRAKKNNKRPGHAMSAKARLAALRAVKVPTPRRGRAAAAAAAAAKK